MVSMMSPMSSLSVSLSCSGAGVVAGTDSSRLTATLSPEMTGEAASSSVSSSGTVGCCASLCLRWGADKTGDDAIATSGEVGGDEQGVPFLCSVCSERATDERDMPDAVDASEEVDEAGESTAGRRGFAFEFTTGKVSFSASRVDADERRRLRIGVSEPCLRLRGGSGENDVKRADLVADSGGPDGLMGLLGDRSDALRSLRLLECCEAAESTGSHAGVECREDAGDESGDENKAPSSFVERRRIGLKVRSEEAGGW